MDEPRPSPPPGLVAGGRGGPEDELLIDGQEEVFSRSEVELGRTEHGTTAGGGPSHESPTPLRPDAAQPGVPSGDPVSLTDESRQAG